MPVTGDSPLELVNALFGEVVRAAHNAIEDKTCDWEAHCRLHRRWKDAIDGAYAYARERGVTFREADDVLAPFDRVAFQWIGYAAGWGDRAAGSRPDWPSLDDTLPVWRRVDNFGAYLGRWVGRPPAPAGRRKNTDARMLKVLSARAEAVGWNSRQWAEHLGCSESSVRETQTWKKYLPELCVQQQLARRGHRGKSRDKGVGSDVG